MCYRSGSLSAASAHFGAVQTISSLSGRALVSELPPWASVAAKGDAVCVSPFAGAASRAEQCPLPRRVTPAFGYKRLAPPTLAVPAPVGSSVSRYTFNGLSPEAWLGIDP